MTSVRKQLLDWLNSDLMHNRFALAEGRKSLALGTRGKTALLRVGRVIRRALQLPRWPGDAIRLMAELEDLHFTQMRRVRKGTGCVVDHQTWLVNGHNIFLGDFVKISAFSSIMAGRKSKITIGSHSIVGPHSLIVSFNHGYSDRQVPIRYQEWADAEASSVSIGQDVWIGGNAVILPGSKIGDGAVIAAGAVVRGRVKAHAIYFDRDSVLSR
jgi:acetyltransferase-like isoleucine patch superfamily enzyme